MSEKPKKRKFYILGFLCLAFCMFVLGALLGILEGSKKDTEVPVTKNILTEKENAKPKDKSDESDKLKKLEAQLEKIPYMLVVGDKEAESGSVSVRRRGEGDIGSMSTDEFVKLALEDIETKIIR